MKTHGLHVAFALAAAVAVTSLVGVATVATDGTLTIADKAPDGSVYAGVSPDTGLPLHTTSADAPDSFNGDKGMAYCAALEEDGHKDWRLPTKGELNVLFRNRAAIGGFDDTGSFPDGWYWSSSPCVNNSIGWAQRFSDGYQHFDDRYHEHSLRCVR